METTWSGKILDGMRAVGDPLADEAVATLFATGQTPAVNQLMELLVRNESIPDQGLPAVIQDYLDRTDDLPPTDAAMLAEGENVFAAYGPEILMVLGLYAIPAAYAARRGVQVLHRTAYFQRRPMRRVWETTQFVVDVMSG